MKGLRWLPEADAWPAEDGAAGLDWNLWRDGQVIAWLYRTPWGAWKASDAHMAIREFPTMRDAAAFVEESAKASAPAVVP